MPLRAALGWLRTSVLGALTALALASCTSEGQTATDANGVTTIRINVAGLTSEGGLYTAHDRGYFRDAKLNVVLVPMGSTGGADSLTMLSGGALDAAMFSVSAAMFNMVDQGIGVRGLLAINIGTADDRSTGVVVGEAKLRDGTYRTPADLARMKLGTSSYGGIGHFILLSAARPGQGADTPLQLETMAFPDIVIALSNGAIDAGYLVEPFITSAQEQGSRLVVPTGRAAPGTPTAFLFMSAPFIEQNRDAVQRFITALMRGQREYRDAVVNGTNRAEMLAMLQRHTAIKDVAMLEKLQLPHVNADRAFDPAALERLQDFFISTKLQARRVKLEDGFDASFVDHALATLDQGSRSGRTAPAEAAPGR